MTQVQDAHPQERHSAESRESQTVVPTADTVGAAREQHSTLKRRPSELVCVHYGGRQFIATYEMAGIFLRRAQRLIDAEDAELVPLVFEGGLELLYVSSAMPFSVHDAGTEPTDASHACPAATHTGALNSEVA